MRVGPSWMGLVTLWKIPENGLAPSAMWGHRGDSVSEWGSGPCQTPELAGALVLDSQPPELRETTWLLISHPVYATLLAASTDKDSPFPCFQGWQLSCQQQDPALQDSFSTRGWVSTDLASPPPLFFQITHFLIPQITHLWDRQVGVGGQEGSPKISRMVMGLHTLWAPTLCTRHFLVLLRTWQARC